MSESDTREVADSVGDKHAVDGRRVADVRRRLLALTLVCGGILVGLAAVTLMTGEPRLGVSGAWRALLGDGDATASFVVREVRSPRIVVGLLAGAVLGLAGVLLQDSLRNPLADPSLLGVAQGASFAMALVTFYPELAPPVPRALLSLIAGSLTGILVLSIAGRIRDSIRVILVGAVMSGFIAAATSILILLAPPERSSSIATYQRYVIGSLSTSTWETMRELLPWFVVGVPVALLAARVLDLLQLGDDAAASAGLNPAKARLGVMAVAMVLVAPTFAFVGPIGFVALLAPHVARGALRATSARAVMFGSALVGAIQLQAADVIGRLLFFPTELPAGLWSVMIAGIPAVVFVGRLRSVR